MPPFEYDSLVLKRLRASVCPIIKKCFNYCYSFQRRSENIGLSRDTRLDKRGCCRTVKDMEICMVKDEPGSPARVYCYMLLRPVM